MTGLTMEVPCWASQGIVGTLEVSDVLIICLLHSHVGSLWGSLALLWKLGRSWADAGQLQTFLNHSEAWSRPREARPKTTDWEPVSGQRLGRSLEVPGLGRAGQMLEVWGWRFWRDLVRCWAHVFNLSALPVPCQDRFFLEGFWGFFGVSFLRCFSAPF